MLTLSFSFCLWPRFQFQPADSLEFARIVGDECQTAGHGLPGYEQVIRPNGRAQTLQFRANVRGGFRARTIERHFNDGGNESLDLPSFFRRVLSFCESAEQFIDGDHGDSAIGRRGLAQPLHHAWSLAEHADAGIGVEQVCRGAG